MRHLLRIIPIAILCSILLLTPRLLEAVSGNTPGTININSANIDMITTLPGIGKVTAEKIIQYRIENGKFKKKEDLIKIRGIGQKKFEKIKDLFILSDDGNNQGKKIE